MRTIPYLLVLCFTLYFYAHNIDDTPILKEMVWGWLGLLICPWLAIYLLRRYAPVFGSQKHKMDWFLSIVVLTIYGYGHLKNMLIGTGVARHTYLLPLISLILLVSYWQIRKIQSQGPHFKRFITLSTLTFLCLSVFQIIQFHRVQKNHTPQSPLSLNSSTKPDVFYVVVDSFGSPDVLDNLYDSRPGFFKKLRQLGFQLQSDSLSNYADTKPSLASSLNLNYVHENIENLNSTQALGGHYVRLILRNRLNDIFSSLGYQTHAVSSFPNFVTEQASAHHKKSCETFDEYHRLLIRTTAFAPIVDSLFPVHGKRRSQTLCLFHHLEKLATLEGPKFVFAYLLPPHHPFVFGPNGERKPYRYMGTLTEILQQYPDLSVFKQEYVDQLNYIGNRLIRLAQTIAQHSPNAIIVYQADHGPQYGKAWNKGWENASTASLKERFGILNAIRLPSDPQFNTPPNMTPVNTFRYVLSEFFGASLPQLTNRNFYRIPNATVVDADHFREVTTILRPAQPMG